MKPQPRITHPYADKHKRNRDMVNKVFMYITSFIGLMILTFEHVDNHTGTYILSLVLISFMPVIIYLKIIEAIQREYLNKKIMKAQDNNWQGTATHDIEVNYEIVKPE